MNMQTLQTIICPNCTGYGVLTGEDKVIITCSTCLGKGISAQLGSTVLSFDIPALIQPVSKSSHRTNHIVRVTLSLISFGLVALSLFLIASQAKNLNELLWKQGLPHALFGLSGLTSMWALSHWNQRQTSKKSLHELEADLADNPPTLNLTEYANPRIHELFEQAAYNAQQLHTPAVDEALLLLTLLEQPRISMMIARMEIPPDDFTDALRKQVGKRSTDQISLVSFTPEVRSRLFKALDQALTHQFPYLDLEDIFLAYAEEPGIFAPLFTQYNLTKEEVYATTRWYAAEQEQRRQWTFWLERGRSRPKGFMNKAWTALPTPFLDQYSLDITSQAASGYLEGTSVRTSELERMFEVLGGTKQNNVILVGEPGVGKTTLLNSLAMRMIEENVPEILKDKRLVQLDLPALLSKKDTAEESIQKILDEVGQAGNVILSVPDAQALVGTSDSGLDAAGVFANALNQGVVQVVTAATHADYHRYIESNSALATHLTMIELKPLQPEQTLEVLEQEASTLEGRQHVFLTHPALEAAAKLAAQYMPDQALPASALTLLDEAASAVANQKKRWVQKEDVEKAIEKKTNIPVQAAKSDEADKLLHLEDELHRRVVGQVQAITAVSEALRRARAGLHNPNRPISSFLFVGPTGVGKTETAKAVADIYYGKAQAMMRLDMSEYQDAKSIYRLIGAPAADSDSYTEGGTLTQPIREHPFSLILLDEIEKADSQVLNLFLQLLDDGRLTENTGRTVSFNNCIIIATSNSGSTEIAQLLQQGLPPKELQQGVMAQLQKQFKPEFINRFDAVIPFHQLHLNEVTEIAGIMLNEVIAKAKQQNITLSFTPEAVQKLAEAGFDATYGARPLRRTIQDKVEGLLAKQILNGSIKSGQSLQITAEMIQ
jgi:ATP-dependent Clp protease ATP-binding subunit ClpC